MESMKIAVSVPDEVFKAGERLARERGISRSELYTDALSAYLDVHVAAAITARLDALYGKEDSQLDPALSSAQHKLLTDEAWSQ
jgi:metal-responsive CopG/Arc/MetJ family transcriptional regulator